MNHAAAVEEDRLADFTRDRRIVVLSSMALAVGAMSAVVAYALVVLIAVITNLAFYQQFSIEFRSPAETTVGWLVVLVPVVGGLAIGLIARYGSEKIRGHGIPEALEAILVGRSRMEPKVTVLKPLSSAISIGTGGPFGAEGPIIMTGGALGSLFAQMFHLSSAERKTLLVAGAAGGMAAIFAAPVAAVLLAVELLLFEWKPRSFIPVALASAVAGALRVPLLGWGPIFPVTPHADIGGSELVVALGIGLVAGLASGVLTALVYGFEDLFHRLPIHWMWWPAIGGVVVGIGGLLDPRVLGVGYDTIHALLRGEIVGAALVGLLVGKAIVWAVALGSGTSGGVLAPLLILGGALGALEAHVVGASDVGMWAMLSMAATMGGTMRSPLTAIVFTLELTHDVNALSPLLVACVAAHAVTVLLLRRSILTEKVARRGVHLVREYTVDLLAISRVGDYMDENVPTVPAEMPLVELSRRVAGNDPTLARRQAVFVVDADGRLAGVLTRGDIMRGLAHGTAPTVLDAASRDVVVAYPDDLLSDAVSKMLGNNIGRLPVVSRSDPGRVLGYLGRASVLEVQARRLSDEQEREPGWLQRA